MKDHVLIPPNRRAHRSKVPQTMGVDHSFPGRKIQQLEAHSNDEPCDNQTRPHRPGPLQPPVSRDAEPAPQQVLHYPNDHVRRHVVRVIPAPQAQVRNVHRVQQHAQQRPRAQHALRARRRPVEAEYADRRVVHAVHDARAGREVVELLRDGEVARVEDHAEDPAREAEVAEQYVVL